MKLEDLTSAHVCRAVSSYLALAFEQRPGDARPAAGGVAAPLSATRAFGAADRARTALATLEAAVSLPDVFALMEQREALPEDDVQRPPGSPAESTCRHYALRLGNDRYAFMKFIVQEYLVDEQLFFSVDTHDHLDVRPSAPDYAEWQQLKVWNRELKDRIEARWREEGLPTLSDLRELCEGIAPEEREDRKRRHVLVVDDEESVAIGLAALLRARGYEVEIVHTGEDALERLALIPRPDLVVLDYELPNLDGEEVLKRIRSEPLLEDLPVLMATAASIDLARLGRASGFLRKPYPRELLYAMIAQLVGREPAP